MEYGDSLRGSRASEELDGPLVVQCHRVKDRTFTRSSRVLNTGGLSIGGLLRIAAVAQAGPSELVVKEAEERALADVVATDIEERADALIKQLEDADCHGIHMYSSSCF
jgi:hypothetical protein